MKIKRTDATPVRPRLHDSLLPERTTNARATLRSLQASWSNYANAYRSLNDLARNLASIEECIKRQDLRMAGHHLRAAEWHPGQAKQRIAAVGRLNQGSK